MKSSGTTTRSPAKKSQVQRIKVDQVMEGLAHAAHDPRVRRYIAEHIKGACIILSVDDAHRPQVTIAKVEKSWRDNLKKVKPVLLREVRRVRLPHEYENVGEAKKTTTFSPPLEPEVQKLLGEIEKNGAAFNKVHAAELDKMRAQVAESHKQGTPHIFRFKGNKQAPRIPLNEAFKLLGKS